MELQVGQYVRTKLHSINDYIVITKILSVDSSWYKIPEYAKLCCTTDRGEIRKEDIINASFNKIDLIEVGDYVNGYRVTSVNKNYKFITGYGVLIEVEGGTQYNIITENEQIKSIVTKEQFKANEYVFEEAE